MDQPSNRANPAWWNHQRYPLRLLRHALEQLVREKVSAETGQTVLDLGCGDRPYQQLFTERGWKYIACDIEGPVDVTAKPGSPLDVPEASVDGVGSFQVLEHVWDLDWYLGEAYRILKPGGWLLLSTHGTWLYHPHPTDYRRWTRDGLLREIEQRGFRVEATQGLVGPLAWTTQFRLLGARYVLLMVPGVGRFLAAALAVLMNLRMVLEDAITPASIRETNACVYVVLARKPGPAA